VVNFEGQKSLRRPRHSWEDINMGIIGTELNGVYCSIWLGHVGMVRNIQVPQNVIILDKVRKLFNNDSALWR
jgi:hypothetical protein